MKYTLLPALALAGLVHAAPFSGQGLPAETSGVVHVDLDAADNANLMKTLTQFVEEGAFTKTSADKDFKGWFDSIKTELGLNERSVRDVSFAIMTPTGTSSNVNAVIRMRGAFNRSKFDAIAKRYPEVKGTKQGKYTWYSAADLQKAFNSNGTGAPAEEYLCLVDESTVLYVSTKALITKAQAAAEGKSAYKPDATAQAALGGNAMLAGYFPESFIKAMKPAPAAPKNPQAKPEPQVKSVIFTLNESSGNLNLHADVKFDSADGARQIQAQAAMFSGFIGMGLAQDNPNDTPAQRADKAFAVSALQALKFAANGESFTTDFSFPAETLVTKLTEKKQDILDGIANQRLAAAAGASAKPAVKKRVKAKPTPVVETPGVE